MYKNKDFYFDKDLNQFHLELISRELGISALEIGRIYKNPTSGLNNKSFIVEVGGRKYLYRIPGEGTKFFCDRELEYQAYQTLRNYNITDELIYLNPKEGHKISVYYQDSRSASPHSLKDLKKSMRLLKKFHSLQVTFSNIDTPFERLVRYTGFVEDLGGKAPYPKGFYEIFKSLISIRERIDEGLGTLCPCHNDYLPQNVLFTQKRGAIILDLEFTSMSFPLVDVATFCLGGFFDYDKSIQALELYLGRSSTDKEKYELLAFSSVVALMWTSWAIFKSQMEAEEIKAYREYAKRLIDYSRQNLSYIL